MQNIPVIIAVFVAAAAIIAVLFWRIKPQPTINAEAADKRTAEEADKVRALQAKLDDRETMLREVSEAASAARATAEAANMRAAAAEKNEERVKVGMAVLQGKYNDVEPEAARATEQRKAAEEARAGLDQRLTTLQQKYDALQSDFNTATGRASAAQADVAHKLMQIDGMSRTIEAYESNLTAEKAKLNQALAKQQTSEDAVRQFENISQTILKEVLDEAKRKVGELAANLQKTSGEELDKHADKVAQTLKPLQTKLEAYDEAVMNFQNGSLESHVGLKEQLSRLQETERSLHDQARALTTALGSTPKYKGTYGELALERLLEHAGLQEGPHYEKQARRNMEDGLKIPDVVVKMPGNQKVIVDAKAVMGAYVAAQQTQDDAERNILLKKHCDNVRSRVTELSAKDYFVGHSDAVELVVLFLPAENLYVAAVENDHGLADFALSRNVIICGPSLLIMLLKSANQLWRRASIEEEAQKIKDCGESI